MNDVEVRTSWCLYVRAQTKCLSLWVSFGVYVAQVDGDKRHERELQTECVCLCV